MSHEALPRMFETDKTTIARTLRGSEEWLDSDLAKGTKAARKRCATTLVLLLSLVSLTPKSSRLPPYTRLEVLITLWAFECQEKGILITDDDFKAKATEIAGRSNMFD